MNQIGWLQRARVSVLNMCSTLCSFSLLLHIIGVGVYISSLILPNISQFGLLAVPIVLGIFAVASAYLAFTAYTVILTVITARKTLKYYWVRNTPPYSVKSNAGLPVPDNTIRESRQNFRRWLWIWIVIYTITTPFAFYISLRSPSVITELSDMLLIEILFIGIQLIFQVPATIFEPLSQLNWSEADAVVFILIFAIPTIPLIFVVGNAFGALNRSFKYHLSKWSFDINSNSTKSNVCLSWTIWSSLVFLSAIVYVFRQF